MAESSSTGNSGTTGTSSTGTTSTTSTSTSTSTSNGGPAASGSQSSSNGSFSTGNGNSNAGPGLSFGAGVTSNSNGNFSGGLPGLGPGFTGFASSNFGQGWGSGSGGSSTNNNKTEPVMTVDEVYGKGNQSIVESQGDYEASSNEKSNVETSTFGKQDEISVTPVSVTKDEGLVNNDAIQSVEGLNFQQKDKESQEVMEAKKSRDDAEAEDNADGMRDQLKAVAEKDAEETETDAFKVGESEAEKAFNEENATRQKQLQQKEADIDSLSKQKNKAESEVNNLKKQKAQVYNDLVDINEKYDFMELLDRGASDEEQAKFEQDYENDIKNLADKNGIDYNNLKKYDKYEDFFESEMFIKIKTAQDKIDSLDKQLEKSRSDFNNAKQEYDTWKTEAWANVQDSNKPQAQKHYESAIDSINNSTDATPEQKEQAKEVLTNLENSRQELSKDVAKARSGNPADMVAYQETLKQYNKNLKEAQNIGNRFTQTDFNEDFTKAVAAANDFMVTLSDGTEMEFSDFATEEVTKSPQYAKAMYEKKAAELEEKGHPVLAKIERWKAEMSQTWLGSKFTFADNQVRSQFVQMAKTDMRATYAAYNNVLNDKTGKYSEADKAEASAAINQANALMTAAAALQASTGFLSGIGDSMSDGEYGKTDPGKLNAYQETLNAAGNFAKFTLGLGVTPGANEAYQNMYYMAGAKVNETGLFGTDFDGDGFALCQEYGNNAAVGMIAGAGELATGIALMFNPATASIGLNLAIDSVSTFLDGLYGVKREADKSIKYSEEILKYFGEAKDIAAETGNKEIVNAMSTTMDNAVKQIEDFQLKSDEVGNLDNWLEGSGSNVADNGKFNQALSYDEWLKLIEADPVMQEYAKSLNR